MSHTERILGLLSFILVLVIGVEIYVFLFQGKESSATIANEVKPFSASEALILDTSNLLDKGLIANLTITKNYKGKIMRISTNPVTWKDGQTYAFLIDLMTAENKHTGLLLNKEELALVEVYQKKNKPDVEINLDSLKKGDVVEMTQKLQIKPNRKKKFVKLTINKLST